MTKKRNKTLWERISTDKRARQISLVVIAAVAIGAITLLALELTDSSATILFINDSECPEVTLLLTNPSNGVTRDYSVKKGEQQEIQISPEVAYSFSIDTQSEPDEQGGRCFEQETGSELVVPRGSTQTIRIESERSTVVFENDDTCPETAIHVEAATSRGFAEKDITLAPGEREEVVVSANVTYEYRLRAQAEDDNNCLAQTIGTVRIPLGETQTIRLEPADMTQQ